MDIVVALLDMISRLGGLVIKHIYQQPNSEELRMEAVARLARLQQMLRDDEFAKDMQRKLDAAVPPAPAS